MLHFVFLIKLQFIIIKPLVPTIVGRVLFKLTVVELTEQLRIEADLKAIKTVL